MDVIHAQLTKMTTLINVLNVLETLKDHGVSGTIVRNGTLIILESTLSMLFVNLATLDSH